MFKFFIIQGINLYSSIRRIFNPLKTVCRFYPSCSEYSKQTLKKNGLLRGCLLSIKRLLKCGPWSQGGVDMP